MTFRTGNRSTRSTPKNLLCEMPSDRHAGIGQAKKGQHRDYVRESKRGSVPRLPPSRCRQIRAQLRLADLRGAKRCRPCRRVKLADQLLPLALPVSRQSRDRTRRRVTWSASGLKWTDRTAHRSSGRRTAAAFARAQQPHRRDGQGHALCDRLAAGKSEHCVICVNLSDFCDV